MKYRHIGSTGLEASVLGFGTMRLPVIDGDEGRIDEPEATRMLRRAVESGINYVDTAYMYHNYNCEPWLGRVLQEGGLRDKVLLATKLPSWKIGKREDLDRYLAEQMERLRTDRIDFYLLHSLIRPWWESVREAGALEFLDEAVRDGRIGHAGFSMHDDFSLFKEIVDAYDFACCLIQYNYMDEEHQAGRRGLEYAARRGTGVMIMEPLRGGFLAGKAPRDVQQVWESAAIRRSPAHWALRWVWNHEQVSLALSGMSSVEQLEENLKIAEEAEPNSMSEDELAVIDQVRAKFAERIKVPCTKCGYCMPCPSGVNIPKVFGYYNDAFMFDTVQSARWRYANIMSSDEWASNCTQCGACEELCPQKIGIIEALAESHGFLTQGKEGIPGMP